MEKTATHRVQQHAAYDVHTAPTLTGAAMAWAEHQRVVRTALHAELTAQAAVLRAEIRAKWLARAATGDVDAVLYLLAQGW